MLSPLTDHLKLERGMQIARTTHGALGSNQRVQRQHPDFSATDWDRLAVGQTLLEAADSLNLAQQVQLTQIGGQVKVLPITAFRLVGVNGRRSGVIR